MPANSLGATNPGFFSGNLIVTGGDRTVSTAQTSVTTTQTRNITWYGNITNPDGNRTLNINAAANTPFLIGGTVAPAINVATGTVGLAATVGGVFTPGTFNGDVSVASNAKLLGGGTFNKLTVNNGSTFDLNGTSTTSVANLVGASGVAIGSSSTIADSTLALTGTGQYDGIIQNSIGAGTKTVALTKSIGGTFKLAGANTYTGPTSITGGTLAVNGTLASGSAVTVGNTTTAGLTPILGGGIGAANGGSLNGLLGVYTASSTIGNIGGSVSILGPGSGSAGHLAPGNSVGTLQMAGLTVASGAVLDYEFNGTANDFTNVTGTLTLNGGGFNLYQEGTTTAYTFAAGGTYHLFQYAGTLGGDVNNLSVLNPVGGGTTYAFATSTDGTNNYVDLAVTIPEPATLGMIFGIAGMGVLARRRRQQA